MGQRARDRREARRDSKLERKLTLTNARQDGRSARTADRQDTKSAAYKSGQNPNQFVSDLTGLAGKGLDTFAALKGGGGGDKSLFGKKKDNTPLYIGGGVLLLGALYMATKK